MEQVKVKKMRPGAKLPVRGSASAAGADLCACLDYDLVSIPPHATKMIPTGLAMEIPEGMFGAIFVPISTRWSRTASVSHSLF